MTIPTPDRSWPLTVDYLDQDNNVSLPEYGSTSMRFGDGSTPSSFAEQLSDGPVMVSTNGYMVALDPVQSVTTLTISCFFRDVMNASGNDYLYYLSNGTNHFARLLRVQSSQRYLFYTGGSSSLYDYLSKVGGTNEGGLHHHIGVYDGTYTRSYFDLHSGGVRASAGPSYNSQNLYVGRTSAGSQAPEDTEIGFIQVWLDKVLTSDEMLEVNRWGRREWAKHKRIRR